MGRGTAPRTSPFISHMGGDPLLCQMAQGRQRAEPQDHQRPYRTATGLLLLCPTQGLGQAGSPLPSLRPVSSERPDKGAGQCYHRFYFQSEA